MRSIPSFRNENPSIWISIIDFPMAIYRKAPRSWATSTACLLLILLVYNTVSCFFNRNLSFQTSFISLWSFEKRENWVKSKERKAFLKEKSQNAGKILYRPIKKPFIDFHPIKIRQIAIRKIRILKINRQFKNSSKITPGQ